MKGAPTPFAGPLELSRKVPRTVPRYRLDIVNEIARDQRGRAEDIQDRRDKRRGTNGAERSMGSYMYVCIHIDMCVYVYIGVHIYIYICIRVIYIYIERDASTNKNTHLYIYIYIYKGRDGS